MDILVTNSCLITNYLQLFNLFCCSSYKIQTYLSMSTLLYGLHFHNDKTTNAYHFMLPIKYIGTNDYRRDK